MGLRVFVNRLRTAAAIASCVFFVGAVLFILWGMRAAKAPIFLDEVFPGISLLFVVGYVIIFLIQGALLSAILFFREEGSVLPKVEWGYMILGMVFFPAMFSMGIRDTVLHRMVFAGEDFVNYPQVVIEGEASSWIMRHFWRDGLHCSRDFRLHLEGSPHVTRRFCLDKARMQGDVNIRPGEKLRIVGLQTPYGVVVKKASTASGAIIFIDD